MSFINATSVIGIYVPGKIHLIIAFTDRFCMAVFEKSTLIFLPGGINPAIP